MLKVIEIAFSCYPVKDMERARKFYEGALGLKATVVYGTPGAMQWTEYDIGAGTLALGAGRRIGRRGRTAAPSGWKWRISRRPSRTCGPKA